MNTLKKLLVVGAVVLIGTGIYFLYGQHQTVLVQVTDSGFVPQKTFVQKGDTVKFVNETNRAIWPASDSHPTHGLYSEFDPKKPLPAGASWSFTFGRAGVWVYHDHEAPQMRGSVTVIGASGETRESCLATSASTSIACYEGDMLDTLENKGLEAALDLLKEWYTDDAAFQPKCHDVTHILGVAAYKKYTTNHEITKRPEVSYCGYGFYHGFVEEMLFNAGAGQYEEIRSYCATFRSGQKLDNLAASCYHGTGHAMFDSLDGRDRGDDLSMTKRALALCQEAFSDNEERLQCASGVFNALDVAYNNRSYGLSFSKIDPMHVCAAQQKEYQPNCYLFVAIGTLHNLSLNQEQALRFIKTIPDRESELKVLFGYIGDSVQRSIATIDLPAFRALCESFSGRELEACVRGVTTGLREAGTPGKEYERLFAFCRLLEDKTVHVLCHQITVNAARSLAADKEDFVRACLLEENESLRARCK